MIAGAMTDAADLLLLLVKLGLFTVGVGLVCVLSVAVLVGSLFLAWAMAVSLLSRSGRGVPGSRS